MSYSGLAKSWAGIGCAVLFLLAVSGCSGQSHEHSGAPSEQAPMKYTVRGEIVALPTEQMEVNQVRIRHEAIPDFVGYDGEVSGMEAMTMPFVTGDELSLEGVNVGDKIEFEFDVAWDRDHALLVQAIRVLSADTELTLAP